MTTAYFTPTEFKTRVRKTTPADDTLIADLALAASEWIDTYTNHPNGFVAVSTATAKEYAGSGKTFQWIGENVLVTLVEVKTTAYESAYTTWAAGDWIAATGDPEYPDFNSTPKTFLMIDPTGDQLVFTSGRFAFMRGFRPEFDDSRSKGAPTVRVTAKWGYATVVPYAVKEAAILMAARWFKRGESAWADVIGSIETGQLMYRAEVDKDARAMLSRYCVPALGRNLA